MMTALSLVLLGFFLGMRHATDADHVIAVGALVARRRTTVRHAALIGVLWGLGHTLTVVLVGGAIIGFSIVIPPHIGLTMELAVALVLILLGMWNLTGILRRLRDVSVSREAPPDGRHAHPHAHGDYVHSHEHGHGAQGHGHPEDDTPQAWLDRRLGGLGLYQLVRPLVIGLIHGLAGSAAVALLVLATIPDPRWAFVYLALFGVGTIVGMALLTVVIAVPLAYTSARFAGVERHLRTASGILSLAFGLYLAYQIGVVDGLFARYLGGGGP